ncbi:MAG: hypothetical protein E6I98_00460 [Chloroflexi bacterium]|nr:MAG: hypothetical protein E6I98_00460 [Chloroflexota bacterium]
MESEADAGGGLDGFELAADPIAPGVVHAEDLRAGRQLDPGAPPGVRHDLALELQLVGVTRVLPLAATTAGQKIGL